MLLLHDRDKLLGNLIKFIFGKQVGNLNKAVVVKILLWSDDFIP